MRICLIAVVHVCLAFSGPGLGGHAARATSTEAVAREDGFRLVARLQDAAALAGAHDIEVRDGLAYLAGKGGSLAIVDVRTPAEPKLLWSARDPAAYEDAETVLPLGHGRLLVGTRDVLLFDTTDPSRPRLLAKIEDRPRVDTINGFARIGDTVFGANKLGHVIAVDVSDPETIRLLGTRETRSRGELASPHDAAAHGEFLVIVSPQGFGSRGRPGRLVVFRVTPPDSRVVLPADQWEPVGMIEHPSLAGANRVAMRGAFAVVGSSLSPEADRTAGLRNNVSIVDLSDPTHPRMRGAVEFPDARGPNGLDIAGAVAVAAGGQTVQAIDLSDPDAPRPLGRFSCAKTFTGGADDGHDLVYADGHVYVTAQTSHALVVLSVEDAIARLADPRPDARARKSEEVRYEHDNGAGIWDPREFGAKADGRTPDTCAIQAAIDACAEAGGGRVVLHGGRYLAGTLRLKSNVILYLEAGATLVGSASVDAYPSLPSAYPTYTGEFVTGKMFLYAEDACNIGIEGRGTIDGSGDAWVEGPYGFPSFHHRPRLLHFIGCENVQIRGVTFRNSGSWTLSFLECRDMLLEGFRIESRENPDIEAPRYDRVRGRNNDGIDLTDCERVRVANCFVNSGDDAICLKSLSPDKACRDITIVNCVVSSNASGIKIGTESAGAFEDIVVANCVVFDTRCEGLAVLTVDGARIERVSFSNITLRNIKGAAMLVRLGARNRTYRTGAGAKTGILRNVMFSGIQGARISSLGNAISGVPGQIIENVVLRDINLEFTGGGTAEDARRAVPENETGYPGVKLFGTLPAYGFFVRHAKQVTMENIRLTFDEDDHRPAIVWDRVENLSGSGLHARSMPGIEPMETR